MGVGCCISCWNMNKRYCCSTWGDWGCDDRGIGDIYSLKAWLTMDFVMLIKSNSNLPCMINLKVSQSLNTLTSLNSYYGMMWY